MVNRQVYGWFFYSFMYHYVSGSPILSDLYLGSQVINPWWMKGSQLERRWQLSGSLELYCFLIKPPLVGHSGDFSKLALEQKDKWWVHPMVPSTAWQSDKLTNGETLVYSLDVCGEKSRLKEATRCEQEPKKVPGAWWSCNHVIYVQISWETPVKIQFHYVPNALPDADENGCCWLPDSDFCLPGNPRMQ